MTDQDRIARAAELTSAQIDELSALAQFNAAIPKPSAISLKYWDDGEINYRMLADLGVVRRYARPPKGWSSTRFFGVKVTALGLSVLANAGKL